MFGKLIRKNSNVEKVILEKGINFQLEDVEMDYYRKIKQKDGFLDAVFYFTHHHFERKGERTKETYLYRIIEGKNKMYEEKIVVEKGRLYEMIQKQGERSAREERLIEIANKIL